MGPLQTEIFWTGRAWDFDENTEDPFEKIHDCWVQAYTQGFEVTDVKRTHAGHKLRPFVPTPTSAE
jgi:hypothetical protein